MTIRITRTLFAGARTAFAASLAMAFAGGPGAAKTLLGATVIMDDPHGSLSSLAVMKRRRNECA
jgi:hypothetical protein